MSASESWIVYSANPPCGRNMFTMAQDAIADTPPVDLPSRLHDEPGNIQARHPLVWRNASLRLIFRWHTRPAVAAAAAIATPLWGVFATPRQGLFAHCRHRDTDDAIVREIIG